MLNLFVGRPLRTVGYTRSTTLDEVSSFVLLDLTKRYKIKHVLVCRP